MGVGPAVSEAPKTKGSEGSSGVSTMTFFPQFADKDPSEVSAIGTGTGTGKRLSGIEHSTDTRQAVGEESEATTNAVGSQVVSPTKVGKEQSRSRDTS